MTEPTRDALNFQEGSRASYAVDYLRIAVSYLPTVEEQQ